ncbi:SPFH domain-containing protein [Corynebacterium renale]|uniref:SPFH domain/Band 7 family protein n=1 Tax=Corynebacterium renale TaxID=1724 RepID=A0A2A9DMG2_9CORY|nr:SPFH domain-containing protein [Corynebacterium renale]PFG27561.1 SPFH domain/Band 7 family protein [Corynebacterium renale]SQI23124.1 putative membrane protease subunit [Corynebacterium renale]
MSEHVKEAEVADRPVGHDGAKVEVKETKSWSTGAGGAVGILLAALVLVVASIALLFVTAALWSLLLIVLTGLIFLVVLGMVRIIDPGHTRVVQFFGRYVGTNRRTGLTMVPPLTTTKKVSVRVRNFETETIKVNDSNGNPVNIGAIVVWQIADTAKASFAVEDVDEFILSQAESALRHVATTHPYDGGTQHAPSLSGSTELVSQELADEVAARVRVAGVEIIEARIGSLSYAPEIAQAMLQRQQAGAIVDARETIVEGAVSMVETALDQLEQKDIVDLDPERRAAMVSNLLVVLCSDNNAQPMINTGSLYT